MANCRENKAATNNYFVNFFSRFVIFSLLGIHNFSEPLRRINVTPQAVNLSFHIKELQTHLVMRHASFSLLLGSAWNQILANTFVWVIHTNKRSGCGLFKLVLNEPKRQAQPGKKILFANWWKVLSGSLWKHLTGWKVSFCYIWTRNLTKLDNIKKLNYCVVE